MRYRRIVVVVVMLLAMGLTTGCAQVPPTSLATSGAEQCEQNRGAAWRPAVSYCEYGSVQ